MLGVDGHGTRQGSGAWVPVYADARGDGEHMLVYERSDSLDVAKEECDDQTIYERC